MTAVTSGLDTIQQRGVGNVDPAIWDEFSYIPFSMAMDSYLSDLPAWGSRARDLRLREYLLSDMSFASAIVSGQTAKVESMPWTLEGDNLYLIDYYTSMLNNVGFGKGLAPELSRMATDYLTQDNGFFIELIPYEGRAYNAGRIPMQEQEGFESILAGPIKLPDVGSFAHLDSGYCWRTYNREWPVVYYDPWTYRRYVLHRSRVIYAAQFEQPYELGRGRGICSLSRAYAAMRIIQDNNTYYREKLTGNSPELIFVSGIGGKQIKDEMDNARLSRDARGLLRFKEPVILTSKIAGKDVPPVSVSKLGLRDIPDGFDPEKLDRLAISWVAIAFGSTPRELGWPGITAGETKADAEVGERGTTGRRAYELFMTTFERLINQRILPEGITFRFDEANTAADREAAEINQLRTSTLNQQIASGVISSREARYISIQQGILPPELAQAMSDETTSVDTSATKMAIEWTPARKAANDIITVFRFSLVDLINSHKGLPQSRFQQNLQTLIRQTYMQAFQRGYQEAGGDPYGALRPEEQQKISALITAHQAYASGFTERLYDGSMTPEQALQQHLGLWVNKGLQQAYTMGQTLGSENKLMIWVLGATEQHCETCLAAAGQIHPGKAWADSGILPQADSLECGGYRCDCRLEEAPTGSRESGSLDAIPVKGL